MNYYSISVLAVTVCIVSVIDGSIDTHPLLQPHLSTTPYHAPNFYRVNPAAAQQRVPAVTGIDDVKVVTPLQIKKIKQALLKHGVIKIPGQNLTLAEQMAFSGKLGEIVEIPEAFRGNHKIPGFPHISPVCNYWSNGTWKGKTHSFGQYWHKDVNYMTFEKGYVLSLLYAQEYDDGIIGGETGFIDACALRRRLPDDIESVLKNYSISLSIRDIPDFIRRATPKEMAMFPDVSHKVIFKHPGKDEECIFHRLLIPPHADDKVTQTLLRLFDFMQDPKHVMKQEWKNGDIIIWDNYGVFHRSMPRISDQKRRMLYRSQIRLKVNNQ